MRKWVFTFLFLCLVSMLQAQSRTVPIMPVDWNMTEQVVNEHPDSVKALVDRLCLERLDTTLTYKERILAFYGQSYLSNGQEQNDIRALRDFDWTEQPQKAVKLAEEILKINPLSMDALDAMVTVISADMKNNASSSYTQRDLNLYSNRMMRIMNTIAATGDGSELHPFYVTKVSDEYNFMRYYLDLWEFGGQMVDKNCNVIFLKETSQYYNQKKIYFECTRVFELEQAIFSNKAKKKKSKK